MDLRTVGKKHLARGHESSDPKHLVMCLLETVL